MKIGNCDVFKSNERKLLIMPISSRRTIYQFGKLKIVRDKPNG